ncbi:hypothetical protein FOZ63_033714 [Perkinsus olseni]|uniref:NIPA-like protein 3 n=1 Tax=Perkinsus olseni TaxID=32597 RepID=A0A7J6TE65_PEROL|nr:hypothetical protein FOZ63_033714 [Perkinsus olseni]KAF4743201.1 hypothetical protein FOZ62_002007 [Perkinsus olseni]
MALFRAFFSVARSISMSRYLLYFLVGILSGTATYTIMKTMYQTSSVGIADAAPHLFVKPGFVTTVTTLAMFTSALVHLVSLSFERYRKSLRPVKVKMLFVVAIPALCDLCGSSLQNISLVYIPTSIFQILKGSVLIFSALFRRVFLRKRFTDSNLVGLCICVFGLFPVGIAHILSKGTSSSSGKTDIALGLGLVLAAQFLRGAQFVVEEYLLKPPHTLPALLMVGVEGFWGTLVMTSFVLPLLQHVSGNDVGNVLENTCDTLMMLWESATLMSLAAGLFTAFFIFKISAALVTVEASAVHRSFLQITRTVSVWILSVLMHYTSTDRHLGEPLTWYSILQAFGFAVLIYGQLVYDDVLGFPFRSVCFRSPPGKEQLTKSHSDDLEEPHRSL